MPKKWRSRTNPLRVVTSIPRQPAMLVKMFFHNPYRSLSGYWWVDPLQAEQCENTSVKHEWM